MAQRVWIATRCGHRIEGQVRDLVPGGTEFWILVDGVPDAWNRKTTRVEALRFAEIARQQLETKGWRTVVYL